MQLQGIMHVGVQGYYHVYRFPPEYVAMNMPYESLANIAAAMYSTIIRHSIRTIVLGR